MEAAKVFALFVVTAIAEIVGCYLPYLWLKRDGSILLLVPAAAALALFVWLLTLHPHAAGRTYAAYGASTSLSRWRGCWWSSGSFPTGGI